MPLPSATRHRADLYALGLILVETYAGALPSLPTLSDRSPRTLAAALGAARFGRLVPACRLGAVPPGLRPIVGRCLAPDPADRYPHARELADDLDRFRADRPPVYAPAPSWPVGLAAGRAGSAWRWRREGWFCSREDWRRWGSPTHTAAPWKDWLRPSSMPSGTAKSPGCSRCGGAVLPRRFPRDPGRGGAAAPEPLSDLWPERLASTGRSPLPARRRPRRSGTLDDGASPAAGLCAGGASRRSARLAAWPAGPRTGFGRPVSRADGRAGAASPGTSRRVGSAHHPGRESADGGPSPPYGNGSRMDGELPPRCRGREPA